MDNTRLAKIAESPFTRLNALLKGIEPAHGYKPLNLQIGEPRLPTPTLVSRVIAAQNSLWSKYPSIRGTDDFREASTEWLNRRYNLPHGYIDAERNILPVSGSREALVGTHGIDQIPLGLGEWLESYSPASPPHERLRDRHR